MNIPIWGWLLGFVITLIAVYVFVMSRSRPKVDQALLRAHQDQLHKVRGRFLVASKLLLEDDTFTLEHARRSDGCATNQYARVGESGGGFQMILTEDQPRITWLIDQHGSSSASQTAADLRRILGEDIFTL